MRILTIDEHPARELPYLDADRRGHPERRTLPLLRGRADRLPGGVEALVATSDLQGRELTAAGPGRLLGEALADELVALADGGALPPPQRIGILLAGDLYTLPTVDRRGATGDVRPVWDALAARFRWVAGVAGNHDLFGTADGRAASLDPPNAHLLDGDVCPLDGLRIGGVGGIAGKPGKPNRKPPEEMLSLVEGVVDAGAEVLVLHEGPRGPTSRLKGSADLREALEALAELRGPQDPALPLIVCGHCHWPTPLATLAGGAQVLNVDARVVVLEGSPRAP